MNQNTEQALYITKFIFFVYLCRHALINQGKCASALDALSKQNIKNLAK